MAKKKIYGADVVGDLSVSGTLTAPALTALVPKTTSIVAGTGATGGGALSGNVTINVDVATGVDITNKTVNKMVDAAGLGDSFPPILTSNIVITVGAGGDYSRLGQALLIASKYHRGYVEQHLKTPFTTNDPEITISMLSGFILDEHIYIRGLNLMGVILTSEDSEVTIDHTALTGLGSAFNVGHGIAPIIATKFKMSTGAGSSIHGIYCTTGGIVYFASSGNTTYTGEYGFRNAGGYNLYAIKGGQIVGDHGVFTGGGVGGIRSIDSGVINAYYADTRKTPGSNSTSDISVSNGGTIYAHDARGGVSQTKNIQTAAGMIFQDA